MGVVGRLPFTSDNEQKIIRMKSINSFMFRVMLIFIFGIMIFYVDCYSQDTLTQRESVKMLSIEKKVTEHRVRGKLLSMETLFAFKYYNQSSEPVSIYHPMLSNSYLIITTPTGVEYKYSTSSCETEPEKINSGEYKIWDVGLANIRNIIKYQYFIKERGTFNIAWQVGDKLLSEKFPITIE